MNILEDFVASIFLGSKDHIMLLLLMSVATILVFVCALIGIRTVIREYYSFEGNQKKNKKKKNARDNSRNNTSSNTSSNRNNNKDNDPGFHRPYRKLKTLLLGGLAIAGPRVYQLVNSRPKFVDGVDHFLDGCQSRLREIVVSTASVRDDAVLDTIDAVLDGFQAKLRKQLLSPKRQTQQQHA